MNQRFVVTGDAAMRALVTSLATSVRSGKTSPLSCPYGGDVSLAGPGHNGAVRCGACGALHARLASLVVAGTGSVVSAAEAKRGRKRAGRRAGS